METKNDILHELQERSPLLAAIPRLNIYTVPDGYFDSISITVWACLQEEKGIFPALKAFDKPAIPPGYFDNLSSAVLDKIKLQQTADDELAEISPMLLAIQKVNVFNVPPGYFDGIDPVIADKITAVHTIDADNDKLPDLLQSIRKLNVFTIPVNYFADLPGAILQKLPRGSASVVAMPKRRSFLRYAAAAVIIGLVSFGIYMQSGKPGNTGNNAALSALLDPSIEKGKNMDDQQYSEALKNLTEEDIAGYLEKNADLADVTALSNNLDDNYLPTEDDYLLDAKTLENYIDKIESTSANN